MNDIRLHIEAYLNDHTTKWATTTIKSERARLNKVASFLPLGPEELYKNTTNLSSYSRQTLWVRVIDLWDWLIEKGIENGSNPFKCYRRANNQIFKNPYKRKHPKISYKDALLRVSEIKDKKCREAATVIIKTGIRASELNTFEDGSVVGKGCKRRHVYYRGEVPAISYISLYRQLKKVGLKPHDLRKLFASRLVEKGANEFQLTELMGWANINTAQSYVRNDPKKLDELVQEAIK